MYHSELVIYNLMYLYFQLTEKPEMDLDILRNAFYEFCMSINELNECEQEFDFETEIENLLENYGHLFESFDNDLSFSYEGDYDEIELILLESIEDKTLIDNFMTDAIYTESIYHALEIPIPTKEFHNLFATNASLLSYYILLAHQELNGTDNGVTRKIISYQIQKIKESIVGCDNTTRIKIKLCLGFYNNLFLKDISSPNINSGWHILLLSKDQKMKNALTYEKISSFSNMDPEPEDEFEEEEEITSENLVSEACFIEELETFFCFYILYLHDLSKTEQDPELRKELTELKYAMFSLGELNELEEFYLETGSLDTIPLPPLKREWLTENHFNFIVGNFEEILNNIKKKDQKLSTDEKKDIIVNLLLLKCYLDLSINETIKNELIAELSNPEFYKNPEYTYLSNKIDEIIFTAKFISRKRSIRNE